MADGTAPVRNPVSASFYEVEPHMTRCRWTFLGVCALLTLWACGGSTPAAPVPTPKAVAPPTVERTIVHEATVYEYVRAGPPRPVPNLRLLAWEPVQNGRGGAVRLPDTITDESGRFRILSATGVLWLETAPGSPFNFVCPSYPHTVIQRELYAFPASWVFEGHPGVLFQGTYGRVTERVGEAVHPVAGATVMLDDGSLDPPVLTHANGFFSICSTVGADFARTITARKDGYRAATRDILWGWDYDINLIMARN